MAVTTDILRSWRAPGRVVRGHLAQGTGEARAFAFLMAGCLLVFVSTWPQLVRQAEAGGDPMERSVAYAFFAWLMVWPLIFYLAAGLSWGVARITRRPLAPLGARIALFWAWLAASPAALLYGLTAGFLGPEAPAARLTGGLWLAAFGAIWMLGLRAAAKQLSGRSSGPDTPAETAAATAAPNQGERT